MNESTPKSPFIAKLFVICLYYVETVLSLLRRDKCPRKCIFGAGFDFDKNLTFRSGLMNGIINLIVSSPDFYSENLSTNCKILFERPVFFEGDGIQLLQWHL